MTVAPPTVAQVAAQVSFERAMSDVPPATVSSITQCLHSPPVPRQPRLRRCPSMVIAEFSSSFAGQSLVAASPTSSAPAAAPVAPSAPLADAQQQDPIHAMASTAATANTTDADVARSLVHPIPPTRTFKMVATPCTWLTEDTQSIHLRVTPYTLVPTASLTPHSHGAMRR